MQSSIETMSQGARTQLTYAANFDRAALVYGARLEPLTLQAELERVAKRPVTFIDQRTVQGAAQLATVLAQAHAIHIAIDWVITPEIVAVLKNALGRKSTRRALTVLSTRATLPADLGVDLRELFPILIAWNEVL